MSRYFAPLLAVALLVSMPCVYAGSDRLLIVISDLHMGVGADANGHWLPTEDFRWSSEFSNFLDEIGNESHQNTDLIIAGDLFELWQPRDPDSCEHADANLGCSSDEAVMRIKQVAAAHHKDLGYLRSFALKGNNRVVIVPGNHDAALFYPAVQKVVLDEMGISVGRVSFADSGYWLSQPDRKIVVEHGQQIGKDVNKFAKWPAPFLQDAQKVSYLQRTWGERFVQKFYNTYEGKYPIIDNIADDGGVAYGLQAEGVVGVPFAIGKLLKFYFADSSWSQFLQSLGKPGPKPEWDIEAIRTRGDLFFVESVPTDSPLYQPAKEAYEKGVLGITLDEVTDEEIKIVCDSRQALFTAQSKGQANGGPKPTIAPCALRTGEMGAIAQALFVRNKDRLVAKRVEKLFNDLLQGDSTQPTFDLFVYGHTHTAYLNSDFRVDASWPLIVANTGAWQRIATAEQFRRLACGRPAKETLKIGLDDLPACYTAVRVKPYGGKPVAEVLYWTEKNHVWQLQSKCEWVPPACPVTP